MLYLQTLIRKTPTKAGVYIMRYAKKKVLYVGKAKNLRKRLLSYLQPNLTLKAKALVNKISTIETIITPTEHRALILENQLIKQYHPTYNIVFRDDKTYPYLLLSHDAFPRITYYRGDLTEPADYFGPYTQIGGIKRPFQLIQKLFKLRSCTNQTFKSRKRPCLQYQMKRCSAPCVGKISKTDYAKNAALAKLFLKGRNNEVIKVLSMSMKKASKEMAYETAAKYRNQIHWLLDLQMQQKTLLNEKNDVDIVAVLQEKSLICVHLMNFYQSRLTKSKTFYTKAEENVSINEITEFFLTQYYCSSDYRSPCSGEHRSPCSGNHRSPCSGEHRSPQIIPIPQKIIINIALPHKKLLEKTLAMQAQHKVILKSYKETSRHERLQMAILNVAQQLKQKLESSNNFKEKFIALQKLLNLKNLPQFIQCFDISHMMGEATVASCVGFDLNGPIKSSYRHINIKNAAAGDDPGAMQEALTRYYQKSRQLPDIVVIDGGIIQLNSAKQVFRKLNIKKILLISIAKGLNRKSGLEKIYIASSNKPLDLSKHSKAFQLLQHIRDEAHRFAISFHRRKFSTLKKQSNLENIQGIGKKRRYALLKHFGGLQGLLNACINDIASVKGISKKMAIRIHQYLQTLN